MHASCVKFCMYFAGMHVELQEGMGALSALSASISAVNQETKEGTAAVLVRSMIASGFHTERNPCEGIYFLANTTVSLLWQRHLHLHPECLGGGSAWDDKRK